MKNIVETDSPLFLKVTEEDVEDLKNYFNFQQKFSFEMEEELTDSLKDHPVFGEMMKSMSENDRELQRKHSAELQRSAIFENNWQAYTDDLTQQGINYARMNIKYKDWYVVIRDFQHIIRKYIKEELNDKPEAALSIYNGMTILTQYGLFVIAEAYFKERNDVIEEMNRDLEEKIEIRTKKLKETNQELESFSYTVSHDLRAPLRAIDGFAKILEKKFNSEIGEEGVKYLNIIIHSISKMGELIDDLLAYSRMSRAESNMTELDLNSLVKEVYSELIGDKVDNFKFTLEDLPPVTGDRGMLKHVIINLVDNAIKFSSNEPAPQINVGAKSVDNKTTFYVQDNGVGFDEKYAHNLFGIFQRLHSEEEFPGTGVGLAIVQRIIHRHNGTIWAESQLGKGTTFYFTLNI